MPVSLCYLPAATATIRLLICVKTSSLFVAIHTPVPILKYLAQEAQPYLSHPSTTAPPLSFPRSIHTPLHAPSYKGPPANFGQQSTVCPGAHLNRPVCPHSVLFYSVSYCIFPLGDLSLMATALAQLYHRATALTGIEYCTCSSTENKSPPRM